ncbi:MAG: DEAD/DEAH box helicase [bacterium]
MAKPEHFDIKQLIESLRGSVDYDGQIADMREFPPRRASFEALDPPLPEPIGRNLARAGIERLYTHQAAAIRHIRDGRNVAVVTDTASGKSLCYNLAVLETLIREPGARALYLFPTKALSQDQARALHQLVRPDAEFDETAGVYPLPGGRRGAVFGTYDGDTPKNVRLHLRRAAAVLLTNPDMLSLGILPRHGDIWASFFRKLRYVVVDELHVYRGVFGSHVANVFRRLNRICEFHGSSPVYVCCSATIANAKEHAERLADRPMEVVDFNGAPAGKKYFILWNPPEAGESGFRRRSPISETVDLFSAFVSAGLRTIVFARAKPTVEVILRFTRDKLRARIEKIGRLIQSYRGGYLPSERRKIERQLAAGELLGVTCTNALELGVDIGSLDAAIMNGYPGTIASVRQEAGRAGRRSGDSLAVLVAYPEPLDQYIMRHPDYFFGQPVESAIINPDNPHLLELHLRAASAEIPLKPEEEARFGGNYLGVVGGLIDRKELVEQRRGGGIVAVWAGLNFPAADINLRTTTGERYQIRTVDDNSLVGMMDASTAFNYLHEGAVYLHQGEGFHVEKLDLRDHIAWVSKKNMPYYTRSLSREDIRIEKELESGEFRGAPVSFGFVRVTSVVNAYRKIRTKDNATIEVVDLDLPEEVLHTHGFWFIAPDGALSEVGRKGLDAMGGLHAVEHVAISMLPMFAMCDRQDIGGVSTNHHVDTGKPTVFIHDAHEGGMGIAETGYRRVGKLLGRTLELLEECPCDDGCPSCIQSPKCGNMNEPLDKEAAAIILRTMTGKSGKK